MRDEKGEAYRDDAAQAAGQATEERDAEQGVNGADEPDRRNGGRRLAMSDGVPRLTETLHLERDRRCVAHRSCATGARRRGHEQRLGLADQNAAPVPARGITEEGDL